MPQTSNAIVIAGMHRSGTSLVASAIASMGVDVGRDLVPPDPRNPKGYFEDVEFLALQRRILQECSPPAGEGHPDWGWTPAEQLDRLKIATFREEAQRLAASRSGRYRCWGWKDPRTTLLLDFWDEILDGARYVLLYRFPWEVADSMQRTGESVFLSHPEWASRIWSFYNRHLIDFYRRHADRCLLVSANALPGAFSRLGSLLREKLGLTLPDQPASQPYVSGLFRTSDLSDPIVDLTAATSPDSFRLLAQLDELADVRAPSGWAPPRESVLRFARSTSGPAVPPVALSIVVPCFNDREFLIDAVASAERHASEGCELVIVNDGSTEPRTLEILHALRTLGYLVVDKENAGLSSARNAGVRAARGRYLLPLDADNRIRPGFVDSAIACLDSSPEVGVVYGDRQLFGWRTGRVAVAEFDLKTMLRANYIDACAVYRREVFRDCGGYDTSLTGLEDWDFWVGAAKRGWRFRHLGEVTFDYRVRPGSLIDASLRPDVLDRLLRHIHHKHHEVFRAHLPWPLGWVVRIAGDDLRESVSLAYWRRSWLFRSRAWRRQRRELGRSDSRPPEPS